MWEAVQLQDISAWGNGTEVAQLLLPKSARIRSFDKVVIPLPPKDTRTVKGVVEVPPLTIYRFVSLSERTIFTALQPCIPQDLIIYFVQQFDFIVMSQYSKYSSIHSTSTPENSELGGLSRTPRSVSTAVEIHTNPY